MSEKYGGTSLAQRFGRTVPRPAPYTYWLTRDVDPQQGVEFIVVWREQPKRFALVTGGATWSNIDPRGELVGLVATIWPADCWRIAGTVPEDSIECIRIERNKPLSFDEHAEAVAQ